MENASKALLIAGAILIVIVLISIGIRVFYSTTGTTEQVDSSVNEAELENFNKKFTQYVGKDKTKTEVIELLNKVIVSNTNTNKHITVNATGMGAYSTSEEIRDLIVNKISSLGSSIRFTISVAYAPNGYINAINIDF